MKATLEFNLPEDEDEFHQAVNGSSLTCALWNFDHYLRGRIKHETLPDEQCSLLEQVRERLWAELGELPYNLD